MTMEENLIATSGPLLTTEQLAVILRRSPTGLRITLRGSAPWVQKINSTRLRLGRRVYFRTAGIAAILSEQQDTERHSD